MLSTSTAAVRRTIRPTHLRDEVLALVRQHQLITSSEIVEELGCPSYAAANALRDLLGRGLVERTLERGEPRDGRGRRPYAWRAVFAPLGSSAANH